MNGPKQVYVERGGKLHETEVVFNDNRHLMNVIDRIVSSVGRRIDESSPMVDARLKDGSRVNAIIPPLALDGASVSIRRFGVDLLTVDHLIEFGSLTEGCAKVLEVMVRARMNILVSGGTGSGKTTLLNVLSRLKILRNFSCVSPTSSVWSLALPTLKAVVKLRRAI